MKIEATNATQTRVKIPNDRIVLRGGRVVEVRDWTLYNEVDLCDNHMKRAAGGQLEFFNCTPDGGGPAKTGNTVDEAMVGMNVRFRRLYAELFALENPTNAQLWVVLSKFPFSKKRTDIVRE